MGGIILGIISAILASTGDSFRKVSIDESRLSKTLFTLLATLLGTITIVVVFFVFGFNSSIFTDYSYLLLVFIIILASFFNNFLIQYIYKKEKLSVLLPYDSLDKIFIVIIGFILFYNTENGTSITTLIITLFTIAIIFFSSVNLKKISFPKTVLLYFIFKFIKAGTIIGTGYFLLKYGSIDLAILDWIIFTTLSFIAILLMKESPKHILQQSKKFYKNRFLSSILGRSGYILGLYIIQDSGVVIATLLGFFYIAFSVLAMKFIVKDSPSKKQIILSLVVITMVGIGYYFK